MVALRAVRRPDFMGALRAPSVRRRGLVGGGRAVNGPRRRARRRTRDPVQRLGQRAPVAPRPGHERGGRDAGVANLLVGAVGGSPGYRARLTASQIGCANARIAGLIAAAVPLAGVVVGVSVIELIPRMIVGGMLVFVRLSFILEWVTGPPAITPAGRVRDHALILLTIVAGFLPGIVVGLVLAVVLFAVSYGRVELVREVPFEDSYRSNVDRPPAHAALGRWAIACRSSA